jgi:hypothetical protein
MICLTSANRLDRVLPRENENAALTAANEKIRLLTALVEELIDGAMPVHIDEEVDNWEDEYRERLNRIIK